jgi:hypothetical protein
MSVSAEDILMRRHSRKRAARIIMYLLLSATGIILTLSPSELVTDHVPTFVADCWSVGLVISSLGCLVGALSDRWIGEYGFLPLLFSILTFYGIICVKYWSGSWPLMAFGFLILAFACSKIARWQDVRDIKRSSKGFAKDKE